MPSMIKTITIADRPVTYQVINRKVKYPRLEFKTGGLVVILPESAGNDVQLVRKYQKWIVAKIDYINKTLSNAAGKRLLPRRPAAEFRAIAGKLICVYSRELRIKPGKVFIRTMRSKWASMSANRNLTLNSLLKYLPHDLIAYVIFHELAHLIEHRHNTRFWSIISRKYKNHNDLESALFEYWFLIKRKSL